MFSGVGEAVLVDQPDAVVVRRAPDAGVRGHREAEVAGHLERRLLRERRVAGHVEGQLEAEHVAGAGTTPLEEVADGRVGGPLPRAGLDVAVGQHEPARHRLQRVDRGVGVVDRLQAVRPVDGGGDAGLQRLPRREHVAGVDVLGAERLAVLEVVPDEVLRQRPVRAVRPHRGLPHVPVGVDHPRHHDAAGRVDLPRAVGDVEARADRLDPVADDQDVAGRVDRVAVVHGQHGAAAQDDRVGHGSSRCCCRRVPRSTSVRCPLSGHISTRSRRGCQGP